MAGIHPRRPRLTLNVGITGHRASILPAELIEALRTAVDEVFHRLNQGAQHLHDEERALFDAASPLVRLHTPLATGADQLAAESARAQGFHVRALLPFHPAEYRADFTAGGEQREFDRQLEAANEVFALPGKRSDDEGAYVLVGKAVIAAADLLVAIWDGLEGNGPGGTAHVVDMALANGVPVIHIAVDRELGTVEAARLLIGGDAVDPIVRPLASAGDYDGLLRDTLAPHSSMAREHIASYFLERERLANWRIEYPALLAFLRIKSLPRPPWRQSPVTDDVPGGEAIEGAATRKSARRTLGTAYGWANFLAIRYAQLFRSGHMTNYALSALAVILALFGLIVPSMKILLVIAELGTIGLLFLNTSAGTDGEWHRRWLQYRHLAESLRPMLYLKRSGLISTPFRSDPLHGRAHVEDGSDWTRWYAAAVWREMDSPAGIMSAAEIQTLADDMKREQVTPQASYHHVNADRMYKLDHRLHEIGNFLMGAVIASCVLFLAGYFPLHEMIKKMTAPFVFLTAGLPAIGAAVFGMRGHGEHLLAASRSASTARALELNAARLEHVSGLEALAVELENAAAIMLADLNEWTVSYRERSLEIPG